MEEIELQPGEQDLMDWYESITWVDEDGNPIESVLMDDESDDPDGDRGDSEQSDFAEVAEKGEVPFERGLEHLGVSHPFGAPHKGSPSAKESLKNYVAEMNASKRRHVLTIPTYGELKQAVKSGSSVHTVAGGKAGYVLSKEGDIQKLFNNSNMKGIGKELVMDAIVRGGRTLDCFDGFLPKYYKKFGFEVTGRDKFNPKFSSPHWNTKEHGKPDVVYMKMSAKALGRFTDESGKISRKRIRLAVGGS
jgi:hypothetical protein